MRKQKTVLDMVYFNGLRSTVFIYKVQRVGLNARELTIVVILLSRLDCCLRIEG